MVVIAAGGTGGHIFPGLALAAALRRLDPSADITFVGTRRGLEGTLIPREGYPLEFVDMIPFVGANRFKLPVALVRASVQARSILKRTRADVAVGMGGYASIPLIAGARLARVPSLIHESGAVPGRANKFSARLTRNVAVAFETAAAGFSGPTRTVGMPLSPAMAAFDRAALRDGARAAFGVPPGVALVVVNGGSQGSARLNAAAVGLATRWKERDDVRIVCKAGRDHAEAVAAELAASGGDRIATSVSFFDSIEGSYAAADITVCRGGAGTVAELAVAGLPAIIVPYPFHSDDHQAVNARVLTDRGAAVLVADADADADHLGPIIEELLDDPTRLAAMGKAAADAGRPHAADELAAWVLELAK